MTYLDLKRIVLQKVFAITDGNVVVDDATQEYLTALPGAANEGLQLLATAGRFLKRKLVIVQSIGGPALPEWRAAADYGLGEGEVVCMGTGAGRNAYDLSKLIFDFYSLDVDGVYYSATPTGEYRYGKWQMQGGQVLFLPADEAGVWTIWYNAYPPELTMETPDDYELPLYPEVAALLPLYIASQIYKDDEIGVATQYRNEFEVGREALMGAGTRGVQGGEEWHSDRGWWGFN